MSLNFLRSCCCAALILPLTCTALSKGEVLGCWSDQVNTGNLYLTRDEQFILTKPDGDTLRGEWKYHPGPGTLELMYADRPATKLMLKKQSPGGLYFVNRAAKMDFHFEGGGACK